MFWSYFCNEFSISFSALEYLLDNNADPSLRDKQGYAAVHYAAAFGNRQNLELVSVYYFCWSPNASHPCIYGIQLRFVFLMENVCLCTLAPRDVI